MFLLDRLCDILIITHYQINKVGNKQTNSRTARQESRQNQDPGATQRIWGMMHDCICDVSHDQTHGKD
nr:hypothetical protein Iba_chr08bCG3390 [Ipomoea batatas]